MEREDQIIQALLDGDPLAEPQGSPLSEEEQTLERLYLEVMGLVPQALEPIAPRPEARARLMERIAQESESQPFPELAAPRVGAPTPIGAHREASPPAAVVERPARPAPAASRWPLALAAVLALAMIGLSAMMFTRLQASEERASRLEQEVQRLAGEQAKLQEARVQMAALHEKFDLITAPGAEVCPLRPPVGSAVEASASGVLYMLDGEWWVKLSGLTDAPNDSVYQLWFVTDLGPVSGGTFAAMSDRGSVEMGSREMPTGMRAVQITLEPEGGMPQPTGPTVLFGDESMVVL